MDHVILEHEALRLPAGQRALLADALLGSLDDDAAVAVESAWAAESERRLEAHRQGKLVGLDGPTVLRELRGRLSR